MELNEQDGLTRARVTMNTLSKRQLFLRIHLSLTLTLVVAVLSSVYVAKWESRKFAEEREANQRAAAMVALKPICEYFAAQRRVFENFPPATNTGQELIKAIDTLYSTWRCDLVIKPAVPPK